MLEIEQKFAQPDLADLERRLQEWGARLGEEYAEADHYFNAPDRDFARTGEAFRLRRVGPSNFLTYKGPKQPAAVKVRTELEVPLADGDRGAEGVIQILGHLGYRPVAVVRKHRRTYQLEGQGLALLACLDEVERLGCFAEVEVLAPEDQAEAAARVLAETAAALGLTQVEKRSYLEMVLEAQAEGQGPRRSGEGGPEANR